MNIKSKIAIARLLILTLTALIIISNIPSAFIDHGHESNTDIHGQGSVSYGCEDGECSLCAIVKEFGERHIYVKTDETSAVISDNSLLFSCAFESADANSDRTPVGLKVKLSD